MFGVAFCCLLIVALRLGLVIWFSCGCRVSFGGFVMTFAIVGYDYAGFLVVWVVVFVWLVFGVCGLLAVVLMLANSVGS